MITAFRPNGEDFVASFQHHFVQPLAARLPGRDPQLRADLICAQLIGLGAVRRAISLPGVSALTVDELVDRYAAPLQRLIESEEDSPL